MITVTVKCINEQTQLVEEINMPIKDSILQSDLDAFINTTVISRNVLKVVLDSDGKSTVFYGPLSYLEDE